MKISKIHIDGFGKLKDFELEPGEGINVIFGKNEAGKSTLHLFMRSMLYGANVKRKNGVRSVYERMRPWHEPGIYRGRIEVIHEGGRYLVERDFNKAADNLSIYDITGERPKPVADMEGFMSGMLHALSETAYVNTVSSGQLSAASGRDMAAELRRYASNISTTVNPDLNADKAIDYLKAKKDELESGIEPDAAREYARVLSDIRKCEESIESPENENRVMYYRDNGERLKARQEQLSGEMKQTNELIDECSKELGAKGFTDEASISAVEKRVNEDYNEFLERRSKASGSVWLVIALLAMAAAGVCVAMLAMNRMPERQFLFMVGAAAAAAVGVAFIIKHLLDKKAYDRCRDELSARIAAYTGNRNIGTDNINIFTAYIDDARKLTKKISGARQQCSRLTDDLNALSRSQTENAENIGKQRDIRANVESMLGELESLKQEAAMLQRTVKNNNRLREQADAVDLAAETLGGLKEEIRNAAGTYVNREASRMVAGLTGGKYNSISAGVNYDIHLNSPDGMIPVSEVSAGTSDQVYQALRLAAIRFIVGEDDSVPLILDDSFKLYDDERLEGALKFISETFRGQVFIFTCQEREADILGKAGIAFTGIEM